MRSSAASDVYQRQMYMLFQHKQWLGFGLYVGLSFVLGLLLVWLGRSLIKTI